MKLRKLFVLLTLVVAASMLFSACSPAAQNTAAEEPAAAEEAAPTEEEAAVEEEAAPAEEEAVEEEAPTEEAAVVEDEWGTIVVPAGEKLMIGLSSALTGGYAAYGQDMLNGVELASSQFGTVKGWEVEVSGGDDQCEGAPGVTVAEKFATEPYLIGVVGPMCSGTAVPVAEIYDEHHIIMISPSSTAVVVTARGYESVFRTVANDDLQALVTVDFLTGDLGLTKLAIAHDQSIYGEGLAQAVSDRFEESGGTVTAFEGITRGDVDFSAVISLLLEGEPDAVYWGGMDAEGALLVNQLRNAQFEGVFMGPDGIKSVPSYIEASGGSAEGSYSTFGAVGGATGYDDFEAAFTELYDAPIAYGPGSFDAARILLQAVDAVSTVDADGNLVIGRKALADQVRATPFEGVTGHLEFTDTGDLGKVSITVFQVVDGDFVEVKTVEFGE